MERMWDAIGMAGLAVMSVGLWTLRVALTARGRKMAASLASAVEALVFLLAFSRVLSDIDAIERIAGYASGVGLGTLLGVWLDGRIAAGQSEVRIVTGGTEPFLAEELQRLGWPVTWMRGTGPDGDVIVAFVAVDDAKLPKLLKELERRGANAFWTVEDLRHARASSRAEWIQVGGCVPLARLRRAC